MLRSCCRSSSGQLYQDEKIEQATDALTFAAGAAGFAFVDVRAALHRQSARPTPSTSPSTSRKARASTSSASTSSATPARWTTSSGANCCWPKATPTTACWSTAPRLQVKALGFFKDVDITQVPGDAPDRTNLQVKVTEQPTGELSFSAGYSSVDRLVADIGISQRNFRGRGEDVRAEVSIGSLRQQINLAFTEPKFLGRNLSAGCDLYAYRYDFTQYAGYQSSSTGGDVRFGFPLSQYLTLRPATRCTRTRWWSPPRVRRSADAVAGASATSAASTLTSAVGLHPALGPAERPAATRPAASTPAVSRTSRASAAT